MPELDVCPVCGHVQRARGDKPGLCPEAWTHPASGRVIRHGKRSSTDRVGVATAGDGRTTLVRVHAIWTMP